MSNHLAIATVTAALRDVIFAAIDVAVPGAQVSYAHPTPMVEDAQGPPGIANLFLYSVTPNAAWRNTDLPTRRADAQLAQRPRAALDLHYLISFYGSDTQLVPQRMLGNVVRALHSRPALTPKGIHLAVQANNTILAGSDLEEAVESVRFSPVSLSLEELSKLWSVLFQTPYALSVAYQATVVLIEAEDHPPRPALPVAGRNVYVVQLRRPEIDTVEEAAGPGAPIEPGGELVLRGRSLAGDLTFVRLGTGGAEWPPTLVSAREVRLGLGAIPAAQLRAGIQGVQVIHRRPMGTPAVPHRGEESNVAPFVLRPVVLPGVVPGEFAVRVLAPEAAGKPRRVEVRVAPLVGRRQRVELLMNETTDPDRPAFIYPDRDRPADTDTLVFDAPGLEQGRYLVRVRVDGAESVLHADPGDPSYVRPWVEVPAP
jgi:hypothetical protein